MSLIREILGVNQLDIQMLETAIGPGLRQTPVLQETFKYELI